MRKQLFIYQLYLLLLFACGLIYVSFGPNSTAHAADITTATTFAPWTEGRREDGNTRNIYGYMVNNNNIINETNTSNGINLNFRVLAHIKWDQSTNTKYYLLLKSGATFKVLTLTSNQVTRTKVEDYSKTALWNVAVNMSGINAEQVQLVLFDDSGFYGFWKTNGVADDGTYSYTLVSPVIGWNNPANSWPKFSSQTYAGQTTTLTLNAPDFQTNSNTLTNALAFDNPVFVPNLTDQKVVDNTLQSDYKVTTDLSQAEQVNALLPQTDTLFGRQTTVKYQLPSSPTSQTFQYGGLKNLILTSTELTQPVSTKANLAPDLISQVTTELGSDLTYRWFYATSEKPDFKELSSEYSDSQNSSGTFGQAWLTFPKDSKFLKFAATQNQLGHQVYLLLKIYDQSGNLKALTNPILVQVTTPVLQVPDTINFGTIGTTKLYGGGQLASQSSATDQLVVNTAGSWQVAATLGTESTNSIRKLNGWLSFGAGQPLRADQAVTVASGTGPKTLPLNAKLNLKGYHHALPTNRNFNETITWNLTTQPTPSATE
ncbi:hypothetical protein [Limosilactobacillus ingluviei]|uniref:hypothetical protein n=1 Tax=Limosilactobacillus ingluviei TaxID=148604 RepID=UPI0023F2EE18|nr:hypothetical protein [Limosilactobacillus ingluviei]